MIKPGMLLNKRYKVLRKVAEGGFSQIFEVQDTRQRNIKNGFGALRGRSVKILKVLDYAGHQQQEAEDLFRREISLLARLKHPAVVQYIDNFNYTDNHKITPCLILEKVPGLTLEQWLDQNGAVSEEIAANWLLQLAEVLNYLHNDKRVMHLDIKPSNIMVSSSGRLVLIDFGIAKEISSTLLARLAEAKDNHQCYAATDWFASPEQLQGRPIIQSDYYAVGRTMIIALTNTLPHQLMEDDEGNLAWMNFTNNIQADTLNLIRSMASYQIYNRPKSYQDLLDKILKIYPLNISRWVEITFQAKLIVFNLCIAFFIVNLAFILRNHGLYQPIELKLYDNLSWLRLYLPLEKADSRISIITVDENDIQKQKDEGFYMDEGVSLSDMGLAYLLDTLLKYNPKVIGFDIKRDFPVKDSNSKLEEYLKNTKELIVTCKVDDQSTGSSGSEPPPEVDTLRISATDVIADPDKNIRRQLLYMPLDKHPCPTQVTFSYAVAYEYLKKKGLEPSFDSKNNLILGRQKIIDLETNIGFYVSQGKCREKFESGIDKCVGSGQIMLEYRALKSLDSIATKISLSDVLDGKVAPEDIKDKIVLIGIRDQNIGDMHDTPYDVSDSQTYGVVVQAHMISQLISAAEDDRKIPFFLSYQIDFALSFLIAVAFQFLWLRLIKYKKSYFIIIFVTSSLLVLYIISFLFFILASFLLPIVPIGLSILGVYFSNLAFYARFYKMLSRNNKYRLINLR